MHRLTRRVLLAVLALAVVLGVGLQRGWGAADPQRAAGAMTVSNRTSASFEQPAAGLSPAELERHQVADVLFDRTHVPLEGPAGAGLGPRFNAASCIACHVRNGRGRPLMGESLVRVALRDGRPVPAIGHQVRDRAVLGAQPDAAVQVEWQDQAGLRRPVVRLEAEAPIDLSTRSVARSLRVAPPLVGLGLLEAVPEATILERADPDDRDGDGISGRPHWLKGDGGRRKLGRFGWKAQQASILAFSGDAYLNEMGITNRFFPEENAPNGNTALLARFDQVADLEDTIDPADGKADVDRLADFMQLLAPPARLAVTGNAVQGERLFATMDCASCHTPSMRTGKHEIAALSEKKKLNSCGPWCAPCVRRAACASHARRPCSARCSR